MFLQKNLFFLVSIGLTQVRGLPLGFPSSFTFQLFIGPCGSWGVLFSPSPEWRCQCGILAVSFCQRLPFKEITTSSSEDAISTEGLQSSSNSTEMAHPGTTGSATKGPPKRGTKPPSPPSPSKVTISTPEAKKPEMTPNPKESHPEVTEVTFQGHPQPPPVKELHSEVKESPPPGQGQPSNQGQAKAEVTAPEKPGNMPQNPEKMAQNAEMPSKSAQKPPKTPKGPSKSGDKGQPEAKDPKEPSDKAPGKPQGPPLSKTDKIALAMAKIKSKVKESKLQKVKGGPGGAPEGGQKSPDPGQGSGTPPEP